jgi:hypothetical protein
MRPLRSVIVYAKIPLAPNSADEKHAAPNRSIICIDNKNIFQGIEQPEGTRKEDTSINTQRYLNVLDRVRTLSRKFSRCRRFPGQIIDDSRNGLDQVLVLSRESTRYGLFPIKTIRKVLDPRLFAKTKHHQPVWERLTKARLRVPMNTSFEQAAKMQCRRDHRS